MLLTTTYLAIDNTYVVDLYFFFIKQPTLLTLFFSYVCCGTYSSMECFSVTSASNRLYKYMFFLFTAELIPSI